MARNAGKRNGPTSVPIDRVVRLVPRRPRKGRISASQTHRGDRGPRVVSQTWPRASGGCSGHVPSGGAACVVPPNARWVRVRTLRGAQRVSCGGRGMRCAVRAVSVCVGLCGGRGGRRCAGHAACDVHSAGDTKGGATEARGQRAQATPPAAPSGGGVGGRGALCAVCLGDRQRVRVCVWGGGAKGGVVQCALGPPPGSAALPSPAQGALRGGGAFQRQSYALFRAAGGGAQCGRGPSARRGCVCPSGAPPPPRPRSVIPKTAQFGGCPPHHIRRGHVAQGPGVAVVAAKEKPAPAVPPRRPAAGRAWAHGRPWGRAGGGGGRGHAPSHGRGPSWTDPTHGPQWGSRTGARQGCIRREGSEGQRRLGRRLEEVAKAVGGGYCRLQMPLRPALGVRGAVAGRRLGALEGRGTPHPMHPWGTGPSPRHFR